jgi:hypothetical protein
MPSLWQLCALFRRSPDSKKHQADHAATGRHHLPEPQLRLYRFSQDGATGQSSCWADTLSIVLASWTYLRSDDVGKQLCLPSVWCSHTRRHS